MADSYVSQLLQEWGLSQYIEKFESEQISTQEDLLDIPDVELVNFINVYKDRKKFSLKKQELLTENSRNNTPVNNKVKIIESSKLFMHITPAKLRSILNENFITRHILIYHERMVKTRRFVFEDKYRNTIVEVIVLHLLNISLDWKDEHFATIAENITEIFPKEVIATYYIAPLSTSRSRKSISEGSKGKVATKFKNVLHQYRLFIGQVALRNREQPPGKVLTADITEGKLKEALDWISQHQEPRDKFLECWETTSEYRYSWIDANKTATLDIIIEKWPAYETPQAPELIDIDYAQLKIGNDKNAIEKWQIFMEGVMDHSNSSAENDTESYRDLMKLEETTEDGRVLCELLMLPRLVTLKGQRKTGTGKENEVNKDKGDGQPPVKKRKIKNKKIAKDTSESIEIDLSLGDLQDSFVINIPDENLLNATKDKKVKNAGRLSIQPYIVATGTVNKPTSFFVCLNDIDYKLPSMKRAIDICFKIFHVFDVHYPPACRHLWMLIQEALYQVDLEGEQRIAGLAPLVADIRERMNSTGEPASASTANNVTVDEVGEEEAGES